MARDLFSIPVFFITFRETLEASIIVSVLLGLVEQIVSNNFSSSQSSPPPSGSASPSLPTDEKTQGSEGMTVSPQSNNSSEEDERLRNKRLVKKLRWQVRRFPPSPTPRPHPLSLVQIFLGAISGFLISLAIGAAFIAVWFTQASDLWAKSEDLWEGIFSLVASVTDFPESWFHSHSDPTAPSSSSSWASLCSRWIAPRPSGRSSYKMPLKERVSGSIIKLLRLMLLMHATPQTWTAALGLENGCCFSSRSLLCSERAWKPSFLWEA
jgi:hypothetical protein